MSSNSAKRYSLTIISVVVLAVMAVVLYPVFTPTRDLNHGRSNRSLCRQLGVNLLIYATDHDERLPIMDSWMDAIEPYTPNSYIFHRLSVGKDEYGFAFNEWLSGVDTTQVTNAASLPLVFTSTDLRRNAAGGPEILWLGNKRMNNDERPVITLLDRSNQDVIPALKTITWKPEFKK